MPDSPVAFESIPWRRMFPWLHLTRAFWIAIDGRKLLLASVGLLLVAGGSWLIDFLPFAQRPPGEVAPDRWPWQWSLGYDLPVAGSAADAAQRALDNPWSTLKTIAGNWSIVLHPVRAVFEPAASLFRGDVSL